MKFIRKPVEVEAEQIWNDAPWPKGVCDCAADPQHFGTPHIHMRYCLVDVMESDWIVTGEEGLKYVMKDKQFKEMYEPAKD